MEERGMTEHEQMVKDCEERESRLTDWERGFIDGIGRRLAQGLRLTVPQAVLLDEVWDKATENG
jgi:hypothetical protein